MSAFHPVRAFQLTSDYDREGTNETVETASFGEARVSSCAGLGDQDLPSMT